MADCSIHRLTSASEIDAVLAVEDACFTSPWTREMYLAELGHGTMSRIYFARGPEDLVVAFCSSWLVVDELHINNLAVLPAYRRGGVATALLQHVFEEGARAGAVRATLEVRRSNAAARLLYERFGFTAGGVRRGYYTNPVEDAMILWREGLDAHGGSS